ncbi:ABC transporter ATP-binding protein [Bifidobacterium callitrichos]|uniref:ABC transporter ATP-binding protein n=1 Tax=Bifidobacterium callitrichos TaxID=762209 RepID=A0A5M9ZFQ4_9BIFI|nr:ABC transporter ATP-binding protein [Bifidobacterium callitrichos]KAA8817292.1 ABC transporter ATP-binding protein [Bifidobacterium callitrichos]
MSIMNETNTVSAASRPDPAIQAIDLVKDYGEGEGVVHALRDVNVTFERGRFTAIMGPSGSGKSTLMHTLAGLDSATSGRIMFEGRDLTRLNDRQLTLLRRNRIGFIFQSFNLLPMFTAEQNILMPLTLAGARPDRRWFATLVTTLGLERRLDHRPTELSGGQQQRVAIARALITKPKLVFADEPTGNLDSVSSAEVLGFLRRSVDELGQTIIMVTHDAVAASYADRAIVFADGRIVADEPHPTAERMNRLLMAERERATRAAVTGTSADRLARLAGTRNTTALPVTDDVLPPTPPASTAATAAVPDQSALPGGTAANGWMGGSEDAVDRTGRAGRGTRGRRRSSSGARHAR